MGKSVLLVHGRSFKPPKNALKRLWVDSLRFGIQRDFPAKVARFDRVKIEFVYYGDISNKLLKKAHQKPANFKTDDTASRRQTLNDLKQFTRKQLYSGKEYKALPGVNSFKEALADTFGGVLSALRLSDPIIQAVAPDIQEYWNFDSQFGGDVRMTMTRPLRSAMDRGDKILVISHSLGTMIAYDTFWKFSRTGEYRPKYGNKKIDLWITLGAPLADETVKRNLNGSGARGDRRYPGNIRRWVNISAEDDYISHDQKVRNDYRPMLKLVKSIEDIRIYNLSVRDGKSNPHSSGGYLIHPEVANLIASWV